MALQLVNEYNNTFGNVNLLFLQEYINSIITLVFSLAGGEGPETSMFHKHISQLISTKTEEKYEKVMTLIRCKISFLILRSVLLCIRGSRSITSKDSVVLDDVSLTCSSTGLF